MTDREPKSEEPVSINDFVDALPARAGTRPKTTGCAPHSQIDQLPDKAERRRLSQYMIDAIAGFDDIQTGPSRRAPPGTVGFYLDPQCAAPDERRFLLGTEIAHVHISEDDSLHAILAEPLKSAAMEKGWAELHPLAGQPTVSPDTVLIYAPRDEREAALIVDFMRDTWRNARR